MDTISRTGGAFTVPVWQKLSDCRVWFASVITIAIRVVSAATTNGPSPSESSRTSASAPICWSDFFLLFPDMPLSINAVLQVNSPSESRQG